MFTSNIINSGIAPLGAKASSRVNPSSLLHEHEDDYLFWQHGFRQWAQHPELYWFSSVAEFLRATSLGEDKPVALVMERVFPKGEEMKWFSTLLLHPSAEQACLIMFFADVADHR